MKIEINGVSFSPKDSDALWKTFSKLSNYCNVSYYSFDAFLKQRRAYITTEKNSHTNLNTLEKNQTYIIHIEQEYYNNVTSPTITKKTKELIWFVTDENTEVLKARLVDYYYASFTIFLKILSANKSWSLIDAKNTSERDAFNDFIIRDYKIVNITSLSTAVDNGNTFEIFKIDLEKCFG